KSLDGGDRPDKKVEQVETMRAQIQKQARAGDCRIKTPRERSFACRKRSMYTNVNGRQPADNAQIQKLAYLKKAGHRPPIVRNPERRACAAKRIHHANTLSVTGSHRFFDEARLARSSYPQSEITMARWRRRHVHGIDFGIVNQCIGLRVYAWNAVAIG